MQVQKTAYYVSDGSETDIMDRYTNPIILNHELEPYVLYLDQSNTTGLSKCSNCGKNLFLDFPKMKQNYSSTQMENSTPNHY